MFSKEYINSLPATEKAALMYEERLSAHISQQQGRFLKDETGSLHAVLGGQRVPLIDSRENRALAELMLTACGVSTLSTAAQAAIQRLQVTAGKSADALKLRRFSALSDDHQRLYIPSADADLILVTAARIHSIANGDNEDSFWVEHPYNAPLAFTGKNEGLDHFERLLVDTQACVVPEMRWFVAMAEGFFPFVRDACPNRLITVHIGPSQSGKTSGAQRFSLLHGLGDVKGDYSVAALGNMPDPGLLVLDNKEQANFQQQLIDYCLFLATGAERARSNADGILRTSGTRPVGVITSIEGIPKVELQKRCVNIDYAARHPMLKRGPIEREIAKLRHVIESALVIVLQRYLATRMEPPPDLPNPIPEFEEHFLELCLLLLAYADIAGKSPEWALATIDVWNRTLTSQEPEESELEHPLLTVFQENVFADQIQSERTTFRDRAGILYVTDAGTMLARLQKLNRKDLQLPANPQGLGRRLRSSKFKMLAVLDADSAPEYECLRRKQDKRPLGVFVPDDAVRNTKTAIQHTFVSDDNMTATESHETRSEKQGEYPELMPLTDVL